MSNSLAGSAEFDAVHVNAEFAETPQRASDHDPLVASFTLSSNFTLQILHASDLEGGVDAIDRAANFAAITDKLEDQFANTLILSAGDNYLPGPFFNAAGDQAAFRDSGLFNDIYNQFFGLPGTLGQQYAGLREGSGRVDISIMNIIGFDASAIGNHEFDLGSEVFKSIIEEEFRSAGLGDDRWVGSQFPYLSANLDFSGDANLSSLFTNDLLLNTAFQTGPDQFLANASSTPKIAPSTIIEEGGEKIGVIGATTPLLDIISSPSGTSVIGEESNDMTVLAAILQPEIDRLKAEGINKIILVSHLQQIALEKELATLLDGVDVIVAGGSDTLLADNNDTLRPGDTADGDYPFVTQDVNGNPVVIVSTDGEYSYVGRLVVDFDENGKVITDSIDPDISGAVATLDEVVNNLYGTSDIADAIAASDKATAVKTLTNTVATIVSAQDSNVFGLTDVFLDGRRESVRTEETNFGNLTADANLAIAKAYDETVLVSIKNGGGIRAPIGEVDSDGNLLPPQTNSSSGKNAGEISELDITNALRFNNSLTLLTVTAAELQAIIEHSVAASANGATPGQFPQIGGMSFSFDATQPAGERVQSLAIVNQNGEVIDIIIRDGAVVGDPDRQIRLVTLNFLADGGDGYPFPDRDRVDLPDVLPEGGAATFANAGTEQDALAEYLASKFPVDNDPRTPIFNNAETEPSDDLRIQNLAFRSDTVLDENFIRFSTFNASLNRFNQGDLINDLSTPDNAQAKVIAEIIQRANPDVLLINEFDFDQNGEAAQLFQKNYLSISQNGADAVTYPYVYVAPSNTGIPSGFDLNNDGAVGGPDDAFGFGFFPGQFGMVLYSKHPIDLANVRTFQNFLWKDMPNALLPDDPNTPEANDWYSPEELEVLRLSSKSHWDIPVMINGETVHILAAHPTPPVFDGTEDRNGKRNHDEIRFWADYITPGKNSYIYDDAGNYGGLTTDDRFVILGDYNADPFDGDSTNNAILQILDNPLVNTSVTPSSEGGIDATSRQGGTNDSHLGDPAFDTADFADTTPGNLRVDYVLPSVNLDIKDAAVFWTPSDDPLFDLIGDFPFPSSDHRLVYADVAVTPKPYSLINGIASGDTTQNSTVLWARSTFIGDISFEYSTDANFNTIIGTQTATASEPSLPVKVNITGLNSNTDYYYRVTDAAGATATGEFQTAASLGIQAGLRFGVSGDWRGELAPYSAISNVPERDLAFFVEHGDTIYADIPSDAIKNPDGTRKDQAETIEEYRAKHSEVYSNRFGENFLAELRASTSILATIDDHEVTNDFSGGVPAVSDPRFATTTGLINDTQLYENGLQAFQEYNPLRDEFYGATGDDRTAEERKLYRYNTYGNDAATIILDNRSFRDAPLTTANLNDPVDVARFLGESLTLDRTMLGQAQLDDLKQDLLNAQNSGITWKFIMVPEPIQNFGAGLAEDRFEGYAQERTEILKFINDNGIDNVVFVAADIHGTVVNNLTYQETLGGEQVATNAFEISTGSVAFDAPFGPVVANFFTAADPSLKALYDSLPVANDADSIVNDKDDFLKQLLNQGLQPFGYDPIGLNDNLAIADGLIDANLLQGDYIATHTYGWTEFDIDPLSQKLTVTTYGIEPYSEAELLADPNAIINRTPFIVSQFEVNPQNTNILNGMNSDDQLIGTAADNRINGFDGDDIIAGEMGNDVIFGGEGDDVLWGDRNKTASGGEKGGDDIIYGGNGDDLIGGKAGNDRLFGDAGDDQIWGDKGDDLLRGGLGNDTLTGDDRSGKGHDIFVLALGEGTDTITDFEQGYDYIGLADGLSYGQLNITQNGTDALISVGNEILAILSDVNSVDLTPTLFTLV